MLPTKSIEAYYRAVATLGEILHCEKKASAEIARVKKGLRAFAALNLKKEFKRPRVYLEIWDRPYMTVGGKSFINDLITLAGGENISGSLDKAYFNCSVEWIITSNPEVIICPAMKTGREADVKGRRGWKGIAAIRNNRVYVDLNDDLIYRLGPRILKGVAKLRSIILNKNAKGEDVSSQTRTVSSFSQPIEKNSPGNQQTAKSEQ
ncbi:MAG: ABC transporter substrate-binding protein, partial [Victivallales bacterium]|nr:ABC transporter substrate-binding protein [Victivallales bacterium]